MVGKESYQDSLMDFDEAEETLSLCDLPIYSDAADSENFSKEDQSSSSSSSEQDDHFEFFSEEWNTSKTSQNIIFCGKLIPYKEPIHVHAQKLETTKQQQKPRNRGLFRWNSDSFNKPKTSTKSNGPSFKSLSLPVSKKYKYRAGKCDEKYGFSVQRVSSLTSPSNSRSYLCMFGLGRFPTEMDLSDIKSRQSRQGPATMFGSEDGGDEKVAAGRRIGKGLWGLIRALGCAGSSFEHATARTLEMDCQMQKDYAD